MNSPSQRDESLERIRSRAKELLQVSGAQDTANAETLAAFVDGTLALDEIPESIAKRWIELLGVDAVISDRLQVDSEFLAPSGDTQPSRVLNEVIVPSEGLHTSVFGLQLPSIDESYVERLCEGDFRTHEHFVAYFSELVRLKLRSRLHSPQAIEDVRQETFARVFSLLLSGEIRQPDRIGAFVNSVCNNALLEHYRATSLIAMWARAEAVPPLEDEQQGNPPALNIDGVRVIAAKQMEEKVRGILEELPERDRLLLHEVFLKERDKDEVCRVFGVDRDYLRVLLLRAKQMFKAFYLNNMAGRSLGRVPARKR